MTKKRAKTQKVINWIINVCVLYLFCIPTGISQNIYTLDLANSSTFSATCGAIAPGKWTVKKAYCSLTTSPVTYTGTPGITYVAPVSVTVKSTGNIDCTEFIPDGGLIEYSVNNGPWIMVGNLVGCTFSTTTQYTGNFTVAALAGSTVRIRIDIATNSNKEKLWVPNGGITIGPLSVGFGTKKRGDNNYIDLMNEVEPFSLDLYPNPISGNNVNVQLTNITSQDVHFSVYDLTGRIVHDQVIQLNQTNYDGTIQFHYPLTPGTYIMIARSGDKIDKKKLIVH